MEDLSTRQKEIFNFIKMEIRKKGYPPSVREIGNAVGLSSSSTVHGHLAQIEKKGYIRRDPTKPRAIEILDGSTNILSDTETQVVPLVGSITAGEPILAQQNVEDTYPLPVSLIGRDAVFMLKVKGDSMIEAGILDGDYVLVRQQYTAINGEIVAVMIDDSATIKRFYKENGYFRLQPENRYMEPIITERAEIIGKVIGIFRKL